MPVWEHREADRIAELAAINARIAFVLGQSNGTTTMNHSGGAINAMTNNGDMVVSDGGGGTNGRCPGTCGRLPTPSLTVARARS